MERLFFTGKGFYIGESGESIEIGGAGMFLFGKQVIGYSGTIHLAPSDFAGRQASSRKSAPRRRPLILIADDEPDSRFVTKTRIQMSGYDVTEAVDGELALERIEELRPDLVLLDLKMPELNGYQVCKSVKADLNLRDTLIVVCSASRSLSLSPEQGSLEIGADACIRKPYDVKKLLEKISRLLGWPRGKQPWFLVLSSWFLVLGS